MKRPGIIARQRAAMLNSEQYTVDEGVRAARGFALQVFDLCRRGEAADQRVAKARQALERVDVSMLEAELAAALDEQASIRSEHERLKSQLAIETEWGGR